MPRRRPEISAEDGQASAEYAGLVLLLATILALILTVAGPALPGGALARAVASKVVCAVKSAGPCGERAAELAARPSATERAYGAELAAIVTEHAPTIWFEGDEFASLPVDYRECRQRSCADTISHGSIQHTQAGLEPTVFTHVVDCRDPTVAAAAGGYDCSGKRAGRIYLQYWLYYPDSHTRGLAVFGGYHADDWESYQVRVGPGAGEASARASSHHSYNGRDGGNVGADAGVTPRPGWDTIFGVLHVAAGSHAGTSARDPDDDRWITPSNQRLVPLEPIADGSAPPFAVSPPWLKEVWSDPESTGT